jgi:hypothetical protein
MDATANISCGPLMYISGDMCLPLTIGHGDATNLEATDGGATMDAAGQDADQSTGDAAEAPDAFADVSLDVWCDSGPAIPECVLYYALLSRCLDVDSSGLACQDTLIAKADANIPMIEQFCADNFHRLQSACR